MSCLDDILLLPGRDTLTYETYSATTFQLAAVPMAIAHSNGSLRKTTKRSLMSVLEKNVAVLPSLTPSLVPKAFILDEMALVQLMKLASFVSFGQMAEQGSTHITCQLSQSSCSRVDFWPLLEAINQGRGATQERRDKFIGSEDPQRFHINSETVGEVHLKPYKQRELGRFLVLHAL